jgi:hypothetical protein
MRHLILALATTFTLAGCAAPAPVTSLGVRPADVSALAAPIVVVTPGRAAPTVTVEPTGAEPALPAAVLRLADGVEAEPTDAGPEGAEVKVASTTPVVASRLGTWKTLIAAAKSGQRMLLPGALPPIPVLDPAWVAAAVERGAGRSLRQSAISSDQKPTTKFSEPYTLIAHADEATLLAAMKAAGWTKANSRSAWNYVKLGGSVVTRLWDEEGAPVSPMYLDGKLEAFAFNKNSDYVLARDHLRIYALGDDTWAIAATRDLAATVTIHHPERVEGSRWKFTWPAPSFGHKAEDEVDAERALVLDSFRTANRLADWAVVDGAIDPAIPATRLADGRLKISHYVTDGRIFELWLK